MLFQHVWGAYENNRCLCVKLLTHSKQVISSKYILTFLKPQEFFNELAFVLTASLKSLKSVETFQADLGLHTKFTCNDRHLSPVTVHAIAWIKSLKKSYINSALLGYSFLLRH